MRRAWIAAPAALAFASAAAGWPGAGAGAIAGAAPALSVDFLPSRQVPVGRAASLPVRVTNHRSTRAVGVALVVSAPPWARLAAPGCARRPPSGLRCELPELAPGASVTVRISVTATRRGAYRIVAEASAKTARETSSRRAPAAAAPFRAAVVPISPTLARRMTGVSWRVGCPVSLGELRAVRVTHLGFDGRAHTGTLIVHRSVAMTVVGVMRRLYAARFPIRRMVPVDAYGGDDYRSIEADNTSAFNCRPVAGTSRWSEHAYGRAIDLNPLENPYVSGGSSSHAGSRRYLDRSLRLPGTVHLGDAVVRAFAAAGWGWGGVWTGDRDYQHFSVSGR